MAGLPQLPTPPPRFVVHVNANTEALEQKNTTERRRNVLFKRLNRLAKKGREAVNGIERGVPLRDRISINVKVLGEITSRSYSSL
jgi:hypothetical protein